MSQSISFADPGETTFGSEPAELVVSATSGLPVTVLAEGPCAISEGDRLVLIGAGTCTLTARQTGDEDWAAAAPVVHELTIGKATQAIDLEAPEQMTVGSEPVAYAATATSGLPVEVSADGPCVVSEGRVRPTGAGTCTLTATQPGDADRAPADPVVYLIAIGRDRQAIAFEAPGGTVFGAKPLELAATTSSGLPVTFSVEGPCTLADGRVTTIGAGVCTITASQAGDERWAPAARVVHELNVERAEQAIDFGLPAKAVFGSTPIELEAIATSGLPVGIQAEGPCLLSDGLVSIVGAGTCTLTAHQVGDERWAPAPPVVRELAIVRASQSITFRPLKGVMLGDPARELEATSTSGLPVTFGTQGPCKITDGRLLRATGAGLCAVTAGQPGDQRYAAADEVQRVFRIGRATQRITFPLLEDMFLGGPPVKLSAEASSGLPVAYGAAGSCEVDASGRVESTRSGACTVTAFQAGDADWAPAEDVARTFTVVEPSVPSLVPGEPAGSPTTTG